MVQKFIGAAIFLGVAFLAITYLAFKYQKKTDIIQTVVFTTVCILWAIEWLYLAGYFIFNPGSFPSTDRETELMTWAVAPLITQIPLLGLFLFSIVYNRINKKK